MDFLIIIVFGFALMWLFILLPQRRRERAQQELIDGLQPGDYILTAAGIYGTVVELGEDDLGVEVAPDVEVRVAKRAVGAVIPPDLIDEVEIDGDDPTDADADTPDDGVARA